MSEITSSFMNSRCYSSGQERIAVTLTAGHFVGSEPVVTAKAFLIDGPFRKFLNLEIENRTADGAVDGVLALLKEKGYENLEPAPCP